jgi:hypothetical protein
MNDYIICIPTYKRAEKCKQQTLNTLRKYSIDSKKIYVYVANQDEYDIYINILDVSTYNTLVIGVIGLVSQRQFIAESWSNEKHIVYLDDDIEDVDLTISKHKSLDDFIKYAFCKCIEYKSYIWGVYAVYNPFFRKARKEMTTDLNYIIGAFYGIINRKNLQEIHLTLTNENGQKEDIERTIKYFIYDGIILRFNKIGIKTKYYGTDGGGLGRFKDRLKPMSIASYVLNEKYSNYGKIKIRKNGMTEFVLKKIPCLIKIN